MRLLLAIKSCHAYSTRADAQRATWVKDVPPDIDLRFFLGHGPAGYAPRDDEVILDCGDGYDDLPEKSIATFKWALERGYDYLFHCDDDSYVRPERLLASGFESYDYVGRLRGPSGVWRAPYCSGFGNWLSARAMRAVVGTPPNGDTADDRFIGNALAEAGLNGQFDGRYRVAKCNENAEAGKKGMHTREDQMVGDAVYGAGLRGQADYRYSVIASPEGRNTACGVEGPRRGNDVICACEFEPEDMRRVHREFLSEPAEPVPQLPSGSLSNVNVLVKTYLRDGLLMKTLRSLNVQLPDAKLVVVDDGYETPHKIKVYGKLRREGHICIWLPRDSGFGAKANAGVQACDRPYVLIASDDFDFSPPSVRAGIEKMVAVLDAVPEISVVSGRVDDKPYEYTLELGGDWCHAKRGYTGEGIAGGVRYKFTELTVNYCLVRREIFNHIRWDEPEPKIGGGEHSSWFIDLKRAGYVVAYIPGVNIDQLKTTPFDIHPQYLLDRMRARNPARPCHEKRGIRHFVSDDGLCEQCGFLCTRVVLREVSV